MGLKQILARFDGKHVHELREAAATMSDAEITELAAFCGGEHAVAATWLVKHLLETGRPTDFAQAFAHLSGELPWEAQLHLLQCVQFAPDVALIRHKEIRSLLNHPKTLLRVWAMDAFVRVWQVDPLLAKKAPALVHAALQDKSASLRARARHLAGITDTQP